MALRPDAIAQCDQSRVDEPGDDVVVCGCWLWIDRVAGVCEVVAPVCDEDKDGDVNKR